MQLDGNEEVDIKKMQEQITETSSVLAQCKPRIDQAIEDLENCVGTYEEAEGEAIDLLKETEDWQQAQSILAEGKAFVDNLQI